MQCYSSELATDCFRLDFYKYISNELNTVSLHQITMFYYFQIQVCYNIIILFINDWFTNFQTSSLYRLHRLSGEDGTTRGLLRPVQGIHSRVLSAGMI